ncbi:hypothetical protein METBIDRAFT_78831 [Metschnikowia bicuspidata var. bicuspidata NRRL YB-4993]|uniref:DNA mismatch repair protein MSH3 n=1 Tax=Metschnikowia bicuspidata var. bicuspidata NRRL YB-4993 TaxID=869754 RepID=A0A1A0H8X1_9ASCO|nr:hypothetical protein METBIDRAFT_78831 [Metschnikowia bicuspidata var. bicuspidata NRRL YB-4993]OBA20456.1 hypothetical protein METBIDRAFT_78831 [Metschnikowia bicuspidata var. bicuspidata NRRL YB-4993]
MENTDMGPPLTPLEQQFRDLKSRHTEKVLAIQVGYKYKFFGQDAVVAAQLLNIMLIPGNIALDERTHERYAYCLIPDVRLHIHLQRLLNHGLKVGVVKQTETAAERGADGPGKSAVFLRHISAVYTKATYMGDEDVGGGRADKTPGLGPQAARYIVCIDELQHPAQTGVVAVQPATGDIVYDAFRDSQLRDQLETRLAYLNPSEVLVVGLHAAVSKDTGVALKLHCPDASVHGFACRPDGAVQTGLEAFFGGLGAPGSHAHVSEFYLLHFAACVQSCVLQLAEHLAEFRLSNVFTITSNVAPFAAAGRYMVLPAATLRALDVFEVHDDAAARRGSLVWLLDRTYTRPGGRMLRHWIGRPLVDKAQIEKRLQAVACLACGKFVHVLDAFKAAVAKLGRGGVDLDRLLIKVHYLATYKNGRVSRKDVYLMLKCFGDLLQLFRNFGDAGVDELGLAFADSELLTEIMQSLLRASGQKTVDRILAQINAHAALNDRDPVEQKTGFFVHQHNKKYAAISEELARIADIEAALDTELQALRRSMNRPRLAYVTNMKETHLIEVRNGKMADALPPDWLRISATKTVARFRTPEVSRLHKQLQYHNERLLKENDNCFNQFLQEIDAEYVYFRQIVHDVARFDCLLSLSTLAQDEGHTPYVRPQLTTEQTVDIRLGCHPILLRLPQNSGAYVPNDVQMAPDKNKVLIITGPNMGGKSSLVKQIALFVIMTQVGCFLPCAQATMGIFDSIYIRMGASDNILRGKSTFMVEMLECASIVQNYTPNSLIILDEIGRGTGTSDGIALAYSILKYIIEDKNGPLTLFITHYPSLHVLEQEHETVANHHMAFVEKHSLDGAENDWPEVVFLYKLVAGVVSNLYGLNVAKLAGIEKGVIDLAHQMSQAMKADVERGEALGKLGSLRADNAFDVLFNLF